MHFFCLLISSRSFLQGNYYEFLPGQEFSHKQTPDDNNNKKADKQCLKIRCKAFGRHTPPFDFFSILTGIRWWNCTSSILDKGEEIPRPEPFEEFPMNFTAWIWSCPWCPHKLPVWAGNLIPLYTLPANNLWCSNVRDRTSVRGHSAWPLFRVGMLP